MRALLLAALLASPAIAADRRVVLASPAASSLTDGRACSVDLSVASGIKAVDVVSTGAPRRYPVKSGRLRIELPLSPGKNRFSIVGWDAAGRRVPGPSFQVFRTSKGSSDERLRSPEPSAPLPYLHPAASTVPAVAPEAAPPAPAAPPAVREYGQGRCGYAMYQTMSIPVTDAHGTHYVSFETDGNGCLPPSVELK